MRYAQVIYAFWPPNHWRKKRFRIYPFHCVIEGDPAKAVCHSNLVLDEKTLTEAEPPAEKMCRNCVNKLLRIAHAAAEKVSETPRDAA